MDTKHFLLGVMTTAVVFGAYFAGLFQGQRDPERWREFFGGMTGALTWKGFAWSVALPVFWVLLYYTFIGHVWFVLGRWPKFNEELVGPLLRFHDEASRHLFATLAGSLYAVPVVLFGCLFIRRWRHVSVYAFCYGVAIALVSCGWFLAPHGFLNWLLD